MEKNQISYSVADMPIAEPDGVVDLAREVGGGGRQLMASNIVSLGLAYAYDNNGDGELDRDGGGDIIWAVDADNDNDWDQLNVTTGAVTPTGASADKRAIRAVRIWMLAQSEAPDPAYVDSKTYIVGPHVIKPNNSFRHRLLERTVLCRNMGL